MSFKAASHGGADWATVEELTRSNMTEITQDTLLLGEEFREHTPLTYNGEDHILTVAPPGSGKTVGVVIPNLVTCKNSMVVTDAKGGSITAQTMRYRRDVLDQKIIILNPWRAEVKNNIGQDLDDTGFNPLGHLKAGDPSLIDNAETLAEMICPTPHDARDKSWTKSAADVLTGLMLFMVHSDEYACTLPELFRLVRCVDDDSWPDLIDRMGEIKTFDLAPYTATIRETIVSEKQWAGVFQAMNSALAPYSPGKPLADHVAKNDFNPAFLKTENVTIYLIVPAKRRAKNAAWLALVIALLADAVGEIGEARRVVFLCEEFANLGYMPTIGQAMGEYREAGFQAHLIIQNTQQLETIYGPKKAQEIIKHCGIRQYFGVDSEDEARMLERTMGTFTSASSSANASGASISFHGEPLMRAQDILDLPKGMQIIISRGEVPPILAYIRPYFTDAEMLPKVDPNPYRSGDQSTVLPMEYPVPEQEMTEKYFQGEISPATGMIIGALICFPLLLGVFVDIHENATANVLARGSMTIGGFMAAIVFLGSALTKKSVLRDRRAEYQSALWSIARLDNEARADRRRAQTRIEKQDRRQADMDREREKKETDALKLREKREAERERREQHQRQERWHPPALSQDRQADQNQRTRRMH